MKRMKKIILAAVATLSLTGFNIVHAQDNIFATFFVSDKITDIQCYTSDDGINMNYLTAIEIGKDESGNPIYLTGRDPSVQFYDGYFYLCLVDNDTDENQKVKTFKIYKTKNFKDMSLQKSFRVTKDRDVKNNAVWAPDLFIDKDGSAYVYFSMQKSYDAKKDERKFDIFVSKIDKIADVMNDTAEFVAEDNAKIIKWNLPEGNYIDAQVRYMNNAYYMIVKDEKIKTNNDNKSPLLLKSNKPDGEFKRVENWPLEDVRGFEGFSLMNVDKKVFIYGDNFSKNYVVNTTSQHVVWQADEKNIEKGPFTASYVKSNPEIRLRHGSVIYVGDKILKGIEKHNPTEEVKNTAQKSSKNEITFTQDLFGDEKIKDNKKISIKIFAPAPDVLYIVPAETEVDITTFKNPYGVKDFKVAIQNGANLKISNKTFEGNSINSKDEDRKLTFAMNETGLPSLEPIEDNKKIESESKDEVKDKDKDSKDKSDKKSKKDKSKKDKK